MQPQANSRPRGYEPGTRVDRLIQFHVTPRDRAALKVRARQEGMPTVSEFMRSIVRKEIKDVVLPTDENGEGDSSASEEAEQDQ